MAAILTKRGNMDNIVTYEFICDTTADLATIDPMYVVMGSVAIVIQGDSGFEVYMANSKKEWINLGALSGGSSGNNNTGPTSNVVGEGAAGSMIIHDDITINEVGTGAAGHMIINDSSVVVPTVDIGQADSMVLSA